MPLFCYHPVGFTLLGAAQNCLLPHARQRNPCSVYLTSSRHLLHVTMCSSPSRKKKWRDSVASSCAASSLCFCSVACSGLEKCKEVFHPSISRLYVTLRLLPIGRRPSPSRRLLRARRWRGQA